MDLFKPWEQPPAGPFVQQLGLRSFPGGSEGGENVFLLDVHVLRWYHSLQTGQPRQEVGCNFLGAFRWCLEEDARFWGGRLQSLQVAFIWRPWSQFPASAFVQRYFNGPTSRLLSCITRAFTQQSVPEEALLCMSNTGPVLVQLILRQTDM